MTVQQHEQETHENWEFADLSLMLCSSHNRPFGNLTKRILSRCRSCGAPIWRVVALAESAGRVLPRCRYRRARRRAESSRMGHAVAEGLPIGDRRESAEAGSVMLPSAAVPDARESNCRRRRDVEQTD